MIDDRWHSRRGLGARTGVGNAAFAISPSPHRSVSLSGREGRAVAVSPSPSPPGGVGTEAEVSPSGWAGSGVAGWAG